MQNPKKELKLDDVKSYAKWLFKQGLFKPKSFESEEQLILAIQVAISLGFKTYGEAFGAIQEMYFSKGSISIYGSLPLALVQRTGQLQSMEEFFVDSEGNKICFENKNLKAQPDIAVCRLKRKGMDDYCEYSVTKEDLELSGGKLLKDGGWEFRSGPKKFPSYTWKAYPKIMWRNRVRNIGFRAMFADALKNVYISNTGVEFSQEIEGVTKNNALDAFLPNKTKKQLKKDWTATNMTDKLEPPDVTISDSFVRPTIPVSSPAGRTVNWTIKEKDKKEMEKFLNSKSFDINKVDEPLRRLVQSILSGQKNVKTITITDEQKKMLETVMNMEQYLADEEAKEQPPKFQEKPI